jgi:hypothetical protein
MVVPAPLAAFSQVSFRAHTRATATLEGEKTTAKEQSMTLHTAILINAFLDLGVVLAVAAVLIVPFMLDRHKHEAALYTFAAPFSEDLAA